MLPDAAQAIGQQPRGVPSARPKNLIARGDFHEHRDIPSGPTGIVTTGTCTPSKSADAESSPRRSYSRPASQRSSCTMNSMRFDERVADTPNRSVTLINPMPRTSM